VLREGEKVAQGIWCGGLALVAALGLSMGAEASDEPRARAVLVDEAPILDGVLDDPIWQKAEVVSDFTQVVPIEGAPPSFRTEVRFLTNNESLFIAFRAFDPEPDKIIANLMGRDEFLFFDDNFTLVFDTFHDHRNGFFIQVNPLGGRRDASFERDDFQQDWDGIWYAKAQIDDQGWVAEIEIPFRTFSIKPGGDIWGLNMTRRLRRFNEDDRWADPTVERLLVNMGRAGVLEGLAGADQGLGLDVVPSGSVGGYHDEIENDGDVSVEPSLDAFYRLLPSLTASLTSGEAPVLPRGWRHFQLRRPEERERHSLLLEANRPSRRRRLRSASGGGKGRGAGGALQHRRAQHPSRPSRRVQGIRRPNPRRRHRIDQQHQSQRRPGLGQRPGGVLGGLHRDPR
jgi:hypothetical protein